MTRRAIVTGGAGFIGSHLVDLLVDRDWEVLVVDDLTSGEMDRLAPARRRGSVSIHVTDIQAPELHDVVGRFGPEVVFHLAAQSTVPRSVIDPLHDARVNVLGTINVLDSARLGGVRKVVFASSGGAIYGADAKLPIKESAAKHPASPYGVSKKIVEDYFAWFSSAYGLAYTLLAPANVYGPRQSPGLEGAAPAVFALAMLEGRRPTIFGDGTQTRDFVYVDDVCDAFLRAADTGDGELLNIGSGTETSVLDLYDTLAGIVGFSKRPDFAAARPGDVLRSAIDPARARKVLGWEPWTPFSEGLEHTVEWFRTR
jgi:UDP-glucose 4-epimerase